MSFNPYPNWTPLGSYSRWAGPPDGAAEGDHAVISGNHRDNDKPGCPHHHAGQSLCTVSDTLTGKPASRA